MENGAHRFRTALFGFSRQDVQGYIVRADNAHREKTSRLQAELNAARTELEELRGAVSDLEGRNGSAAAEEAKVRASLEEATRSLSQVRGELREAGSRLAQARGELEHLQGQVGELEPAAKSYEQLKERVALIELEAHQKAQQTLDEAERQAARRRQETGEWLSTVLERYSRLRGAVDTLDEHMRTFADAADALWECDDMAKQLAQETEG